MLLGVLTTTLALTAIIGLRYLLVAWLAHRLLWSRSAKARRLSRRDPERAAMRRELIASLVSSPIYALPAALIIELWKRGGTALYSDLAAYPPWWLPVSFLIYLVAQDAFYYWLHRLLHHPSVFPWAHREHHRSNDPTAYASFAFDPAEAALTAWFLPALALFIPLHVGVALLLLATMTAAAVVNHAGKEIWPKRWLERAPLRWLITATHHDAHHKRYRSNYGLYFRYWDQWMGTEAEPQGVRKVG